MEEGIGVGGPTGVGKNTQWPESEVPEGGAWVGPWEVRV